MVRWWWFGPAVTKPELEREMRIMKEGGIGGFEVQPVYPLELDDPATASATCLTSPTSSSTPCASPAPKRRELGLRIDLTLGSGWPFGGPHIPLALGRPRAPAHVQRGATLRRPRAKARSSSRLIPATAPASYFVASHTRMMVKRAAVGAEGFVLDHYDRAAIDAHLHAVGDRLAQAFGQNPPYAVFSDSLEVDAPIGPPIPRRIPQAPRLRPDALPARARRRHRRQDRGHPPRLGPHPHRTRRRELPHPIREWAHQHGTLFRSQTYGTPPVTLSSNALVDLPEGEGSPVAPLLRHALGRLRQPSYGRPVTSSETWTWLHSPVFRATPLDMKAEADLHFLQGINQLVGHGFPYSPPVGRRARMALLRRRRLQPAQSLVAGDARYHRATCSASASCCARASRPTTWRVYLPTDDAWAAFTPGNDLRQ